MSKRRDGSEATARQSTMCHGCGGQGHLLEPVCAVIGGSGRSLPQLRPCRWCGETGRVPGLTPPT
ncbi:hypothetical protein [Actinoalloteichus spitiensis]|uniref:hypothetical protein n=1 Tax=Actinoalloteichus spitiensis TaxID=252394 RepID=UPI00037CA53A|nr:hypothetical protein [Actinoalloteichus spitiensis]